MKHFYTNSLMNRPNTERCTLGNENQQNRYGETHAFSIRNIAATVIMLLVVCLGGNVWGQQALPYSYGFENNDLAAEGWTLNSCHANTGISASYYKTGVYGFAFRWNTAPPQYLISPELTGTGGGVNVKFAYKNVSTSWVETFYVGYSTTTNAPASFTWGTLITASDGEWHDYENSFPPNTKYIAIRLESNDKYYLALDDFEFTSLSSCPQPTNVTVSDITDNSAQVSWTGSAEANSYNLQYRIVKFSYDFESANAWAVDDFSPCTTYDGDGGGTYGIDNITFTNNYYTGSFIAFQNGITANATAHGGNSFGACFDAVEDVAPNNDFFILPEITISNGDRLTFWARSFNSTYGLEQFKVGVYASNGTFSSYLAGSATTSVDAPVEWTEFSYDLSAYAGQTIQLAINCVSNDVFAFFIDDITVSSDWTTVNNVTSPYTLTDLYPVSTCEVQVQADCGGDGESDWTSDSFITPLPTPTITQTNDPLPECGSGNATLVASVSNVPAGYTFHWYSNSTCTTEITSGVTGTNNNTLSYPATSGAQVWCRLERHEEGTTTEEEEFSYTGNVQTYAIPAGATSLTLEVWGAQGGEHSYSYGTPGKGGYSVGTLSLANLGTLTNLYVYVGQQGGGTSSAGGWNGGGKSNSYGGAGGGATDIATRNTAWNNTDHYYSRIIVAGGGGGEGYCSSQNTNGGDGGGISGGNGTNGTNTGGYGATQTSGGTNNATGSFGTANTTHSNNGGGGGGGWYGGSSGINGGTDSGGGGGSGYVYTSTTAANYPTGCLLNSNYYLTAAETTAGQNTGNGKAKITATVEFQIDLLGPAEEFTIHCSITECEGFEGSSLPAGWTSDGDGTWEVTTGDDNGTAIGAHTGTYNALCVHTDRGDETYLITPMMDFGGVAAATLSFWYINREWAGDIDELTVYYRINGGAWSQLFNTTDAHATWTEQVINLPAAALSAYCQIGFKMTDNYGYGIGIDDVCFTYVAPVCIPRTANIEGCPSTNLSSGQAITLVGSVSDGGGTAAWFSSSTSVAEVTNGAVTAREPGTTTITYMNPYNGTYCSASTICNITVVCAESSAAFNFNPSSGSMVDDGRLDLGALLNNGTGQTVSSWSSSNTGVATVSNGVVSGVRAGGPITITARVGQWTSGGITYCEKTATYELTVTSDGCKQIGAGTGTTANLPIRSNSTSSYSYTQQLYKATELTSAGACKGGITDIKFRYNATDYNQPLEVYMGSTVQTSLAAGWISDANLELVYSGTISFARGWNTIHLTTPYYWDGESNIVVAVRTTAPPSSTSRNFYYTSTTGGARYCYNSGSAVSLNGDNVPSVTGTSSSYRPNIRFCIDCCTNRDGHLNITSDPACPASIPYGSTLQLTGSVESGYGAGTASWSTSNADVATVSNGGLVSPSGVGSAVITYTRAYDGTYCKASTTCTVNITVPTPTITQTDDPLPQCDIEDATLVASVPTGTAVPPGYTYHWYSNSTCTTEITSGVSGTNNNTLSYPAASATQVWCRLEKRSTTTTFNYTGNVQTFNVPTGTIMLTMEVWGAEGGGQRLSGNTNSGYGGKGGYSIGTLSSPTGPLYVCVGGYGSSSTSGAAAGGYNGGGSGYASSNTEPGNGGGGATHIATADGVLSSLSGNTTAVLIVAGGGGGGGEDGSDKGGDGGGESGENGRDSGTPQADCAGGTQSAGGPNASFGQGATTNSGDGGGGGGGWYGGGTKQSASTGTDTYGGGGGSGYLNPSLTSASTTTSEWTGNGQARFTVYPEGLIIDSTSLAGTVTINCCGIDATIQISNP